MSHLVKTAARKVWAAIVWVDWRLVSVGVVGLVTGVVVMTMLMLGGAR